jgi:hypothetical protein
MIDVDIILVDTFVAAVAQLSMQKRPMTTRDLAPSMASMISRAYVKSSNLWITACNDTSHVV